MLPNNEFVQEYLYIEDFFVPVEKDVEKENDSNKECVERGVIVLDIL